MQRNIRGGRSIRALMPFISIVATACRERAEGLGRAGVEPENADSIHDWRFFAPSRRRCPRQRRREGGGTAKRRARRSRGRRPVPARVAGSRECRAGRPRVRRAPEAPAARRFPEPLSADTTRELAARLSVGFQRLHASAGAGVTRTRVRSRTATARFGRREAGRTREG